MTTAATTGVLSARRALRTLYLVRAGVSILWLALLAISAGSTTMVDTTPVSVGILLIVYPAWDVAATLIDFRSTGARGVGLLQRINIGVSSAATVAMVVAVVMSVGDAVFVFGIWAVAAGALTLVVAIRRLRSVGIQWPMFISGGLALFIGSSFLAQAGDASASPSILVSYAGGGVLWFILGAIVLIRKPRPSATV